MSLAPDPTRILQTGFGYGASKVLLTGVEQEAGFRSHEIVHLAGPCSAAIGYKSWESMLFTGWRNEYIRERA